MAYLGNPPAVAYSTVSYQDLTGGTGTSFTLDNAVANENEIEVFVNNVRQEPSVAYTASGTSLTMTGSVVATDDFYVVFQGKAQQTVTSPEKQTNGDFNFDGGTLYVDSTNNQVGIGTSSPEKSLHILGSDADLLKVQRSAAGNTAIQATDGTDTVYFGMPTGGGFAVDGDANLATGPWFKIDDTTGNVGIGTSSPDRVLDVRADPVEDWQIRIGANNADADTYDIGRDVSDGLLYFYGNQSGFNGYVFGGVNGERMRIDSSGNLLVGTTDSAPAVSNVEGHSLKQGSRAEFSNDGGTVVFVNRLQDGTLVSYRSEGIGEGNVSISGTTVSYNGGHLARWSRLVNNSKDTSIVKGTVMTNLDEMVEWSHETTYWTEEDELPDGVSVGDVKTVAYVEANEQLNKMAVSSVEGDANVSGVFVNWDEEDDWNDMNVAMTGDMVIRIAQGTTVARGDLLMSAGDGTAKPQGDDIVRSKTIAKVTSTHVSHTYDDGSYLVPCVLMAC